MGEGEVCQQQGCQSEDLDGHTVRVVVKHEPKVSEGEHEVGDEGYGEEGMEELGKGEGGGVREGKREK